MAVLSGLFVPEGKDFCGSPPPFAADSLQKQRKERERVAFGAIFGAGFR
jgi:hypothetical protein